MKTILLSHFCLLVLLINCSDRQNASDTSVNAADTSVNEETTARVLNHHWDAFQANDLEATMEDYTEESVLITPDRTFKGLSEIRENFVFAFSVFPKDSSALTLSKTVVKDDVGYIIWNAKTPKLNLTFATDTFIIQNGKIVRQTYAGVVAP